MTNNIDLMSAGLNAAIETSRCGVDQIRENLWPYQDETGYYVIKIENSVPVEVCGIIKPDAWGIESHGQAIELIDRALWIDGYDLESFKADADWSRIVPREWPSDVCDLLFQRVHCPLDKSHFMIRVYQIELM